MKKDEKRVALSHFRSVFCSNFNPFYLIMNKLYAIIGVLLLTVFLRVGAKIRD